MESVDNEAGNLFEILCYGKIQKKFNLKQLLFIANEKNDDLTYNEFKNQYIKCENGDLDKIIDNFPENQFFSKYVLEIKRCLKIEKNLKENKDKTSEEIIGNKILVKKDDEINNNSSNLLEYPNAILITEKYRYNNHLIEEKYSF